MMECMQLNSCLLVLLALLFLSLYFNLRFSLALKEKDEGTKKLIKQAYFHPITELPNRTNMDLIVSEQVERAKRHKKSFVVGAIIIKNYNEKFIFAASNLILDALRNEDVLAHIEDETFLVLFNEYLEERNFELILQRIKKIFDKKITNANGESFKFEVGIGHCTYPKDGISMDEFISSAKNLA